MSLCGRKAMFKEKTSSTHVPREMCGYFSFYRRLVSYIDAPYSRDKVQGPS